MPWGETVRRVILTVDWDFFVPEDVLWDMGHAETPLHLSILWITRGELVDKMKTDGNEKSFWSLLKSKFEFNVDKIHIADSHLSMLDVVRKDCQDEIILFDAHHDCWPIKKKHIDCSNWARECLRAGIQVTWVYPEHCNCETPRIDGLTSLSYKEFLARDWDVFVEVLHSCRSGCWTPPWLDDNYQNFINELGIDRETMMDPPWDGWSKRWTDGKELSQAVEMATKISSFVRNPQQDTLAAVLPPIGGEIGLSSLPS